MNRWMDYLIDDQCKSEIGQCDIAGSQAVAGQQDFVGDTELT